MDKPCGLRRIGTYVRFIRVTGDHRGRKLSQSVPSTTTDGQADRGMSRFLSDTAPQHPLRDRGSINYRLGDNDQRSIPLRSPSSPITGPPCPIHPLPLYRRLCQPSVDRYHRTERYVGDLRRVTVGRFVRVVRSPQEDQARRRERMRLGFPRLISSSSPGGKDEEAKE
jgi:hypothetical protein